MNDQTVGQGGNVVAHRISRRALLRATVAGFLGTGIGGGLLASSGFAPWARAAGSPLSATVGEPTAGPSRRRYRSRPDLTPPVITVSGPGTGLGPGCIFLTPANGAAPDGPMMTDDAGELIWLRPDSGPLSAADLTVSTYRGEPVLAWWEGQGLTGYGRGEYVLADTSYREIARVRAGHGYQGDLHEFILTPEGTALFVIYNTVPGEVPTLRGLADGPVTESVIQEVDVATGRVLFEWHSMEHVSALESFLELPKAPGEPYDYFHANSIGLDADGNVLLSARHPWAVYKIDRGSGAILWRLGGSRSDFRLGPGAWFAWQHHACWQPDGTMTIYDNGANGPPPQFEAASRGIVLGLDTTAMTATLLRAWTHPDGVLSSSQGSLELLPNGNAFVGYGNVPRFSEFASDGRLLLDGAFTTRGSYRAFRYPWIGRPTDQPAIAVDVSGASPVLYASWNGATEVASWSLLGGPSAGELRILTSVLRTGFETAIAIPSGSAFVAARAVAADGSVLGTSQATRVA